MPLWGDEITLSPSFTVPKKDGRRRGKSRAAWGVEFKGGWLASEKKVRTRSLKGKENARNRSETCLATGKKYPARRIKTGSRNQCPCHLKTTEKTRKSRQTKRPNIIRSEKENRNVLCHAAFGA